MGLWKQNRTLIGLFVLAFCLRFVALIPYSLHHPDEIFQYLEPAHKLVFGYGIETWEYHYGMRGWLLPLLLAGPMALGHAVAPDSALYLQLPRLASMLFTLLIPIAAYRIGAQRSTRHGLVAFAVMAVWYETIYFSAHILTEVLATSTFLMAAALMMDGNAARLNKRYFIGGLLFGLTFAFRFHYAPAIAIFVIIQCGRDLRGCWLPAMGGGLLALTIAGLADIACGATPLWWIIANVTQNIVHNRSADFGISPFYWYAIALVGYWLWATPVILTAMLPVARRYRALLSASLVNLLLLSLIGHKEYRFILLTSTIFVMVAAIGSLDLIDRWREEKATLRKNLAIAIGIWTLLSASIAMGPYMRNRWANLSPELMAAQTLSTKAGICGVGLHRMDFWHTGGYSYLHRPVPIYLTYVEKKQFISAEDIASKSDAFDVILSRSDQMHSLPKQYRAVFCYGGGANRVCILRRSGGCRPEAASDWQLQAILAQNYD